MIPKVIHYCWFGSDEIPAKDQACIQSWRHKLANYTIKRWDESNFDVNAHPYTREAYASGKYAFVSDFVRLKTLMDHGGIYLDTDVEVIKPLDDLLTSSAFAGFENAEGYIASCVLGAEPGNPWVAKLYESYKKQSFLDESGQPNLIPNVVAITQITTGTFGFRSDGTFQDHPGVLTLYPQDWFSPKDYSTGALRTSHQTRTIHHFHGSWKDTIDRTRKSRNDALRRLLGKRIGDVIASTLIVLERDGFRGLVKRFKARIRTSN